MKISMRIVTLALFALCMALFTSGAFAQTSTTGTIEGNVVDTNGNAVPGVTVTVTSPNLITAQSATTNDEGRYRILNLPPGRYTVAVASSQGFAEFKQENVEVNLSRSSSVAITLQPAGTTAVVNVTDTAGANVDVTTNTTGTNVSTEQFSNFPTQRTIQSIYTIAPTAARSGLRDVAGRDRDPSIAGSSGPENNYILDGVNTTDPGFGGAGANLPFEFVQEVEIKTGAFGAEYGKATGGIFNVITKSGSNEIRGDAFAYFTAKSFVRETKNFPNTGSAPNGFSEVDAGFDIGGPIKKDKLWFFGAFNPQFRKNFYLTQFFRRPEENKVKTPFYAGKLTWAINQNNVFNASTFADYTSVEGFGIDNIQALRNAYSGFGADPSSFRGRSEIGGSNYAFRLNSTITPTMIGEFTVGLHFQRNNAIPEEPAGSQSLATDNFAVIRNGAAVPVTVTNINPSGTGQAAEIAFVNGIGGSLQRNFVRQGFGLITNGDRNRYEMAARMQNIWGQHTLKYGFEYNRNLYSLFTRPSGPARTFADPFGEEAHPLAGIPATNYPSGLRVTNNFGVCTVNNNVMVCPSSALTTRANLLFAAGLLPAGVTVGATNGALTDVQLSQNPFLILTSVRVRDFVLDTQGQSTKTNVESFYVQDDYKISRNVQVNAGLRWDYQQAYGISSTYIRLNSFMDNMQPRFGLIYDFTGKGKGKLFINYARYVETPLPLDLNVRAGGDEIQIDKQANVTRYNAAPGSVIFQGTASGLGCLGCEPSPPDPDLKPQTVNEATAGFEYEIARDLAIGVRGIYRAQGTVIEDGSFDDGAHYFIFNPGESLTEVIARQPVRFDANGDQVFGLGIGGVGSGFGRARRYYRALELTATKRFSNNYQFIASYVYSSLIGNYEGLFRNDNGQSDPNITSLFDLPSLLNNLYGRLPNDRPHQFKFNGSYQTPFKLLVSTNFYIQSGIPFSQLIPHPVYGNNEGFGAPRGTAQFPADAPGGITKGSNRTPTTYQLDLGAYYPIQVGENKQLRLQVDWFNVTNQQRAITVDQTFRINSGISGANAIQFFNPFYGQGLIFQFPSSLRLGAKFQF
jgi:outer membrane receptor protein involved in Fe transport